MPQLLNRTAAVCSLLFSFAILNPSVTIDKTRHGGLPGSNNSTPKIQVAILLDVSNSMDGLIGQAKNQLWNMVNVLGKVTCNGIMPSIEISLYEYGRPENDPNNGFVKQITPFTNDLDKLFAELVKLNTHGGDEYCGHVMYNSLTQLAWDTISASYKVIFIAGNESFLQGDISFSKACEEAKKKGVVINTIYCGDRNKGILENWKLGAECGNGSFSNIDQDANPLLINTPYDDSIIRLKEKLDETFIVYGREGEKLYTSMLQADTFATYGLIDPSKISKYVIIKSNKNLNSHPDWDLVDAMEKNAGIINTIDMKTLDDSLKNKSRNELKQIVEAKIFERKRIREQVADLSVKQEKYIKAEKEKTTEPQTLESEIERIIREQVTRVKMIIQ